MILRLISTSFFVFSMLLSTFSVAQQIDKHWYVAVGSGGSKLSPDVSESDFEVTNDSDTNVGVALGLDFNKRMSFELAAAQLGDAALTGNSLVSYSSVGVSGLYHLLGNADDISRREGLWGYARFGVNRIGYSPTNVELSASNAIAWQFGAGVEWALARNWSVRTEASSYGEDAQTVNVSLLWRGRRSLTSQKGTSSVQVKSPEVVERTEIPEPTLPEVVERTEIPEPKSPLENSEGAVVVVVPEPEETNSNAGLDESAGDCAVPAPGEPLDDRGCAVFSGITAISFFDGTAELTSEGQMAVQDAADNMMKYTAVNLEISAHADLETGSKAALELSRARAVAVARTMVQSGVPVNRLQARAFGDSQPRLNDESPLAMQLNNRVVFNVLP